ncbi:hypothetical protein TSAR_002820 [Trichomalopsis sarcophagae]|uniref:Uncharacterized protein n=1 Tax=Trichomalopsis sarcophagae TaxID=543379 RepID=A0A232F459_9HYME|nr:hypothetical protein TSAR_002820 [Trichomalopsis sarcophagae]
MGTYLLSQRQVDNCCHYFEIFCAFIAFLPKIRDQHKETIKRRRDDISKNMTYFLETS